ncbi:hypothetical protein SAMN05446037_100685 [Anaerovirgula multivorans]|uniref:Uncharacterized protein n=1 Tax=Anaerovirgula multivorans TaxID=312168 RepID=A0A239CPL2_9FIRM|nr:hypothetical protein [Anaerovirgula multivorans]SNS22080.1 hypothetical protein SAMN05446037_100685 [Anaerovirgula multivorans]
MGDNDLKLYKDVLDKLDRTNQRLAEAVIIAVIAFSLAFTLTVVSITYLFFRSDRPHLSTASTNTSTRPTVLTNSNEIKV